MASRDVCRGPDVAAATDSELDCPLPPLKMSDDIWVGLVRLREQDEERSRVAVKEAARDVSGHTGHT